MQVPSNKPLTDERKFEIEESKKLMQWRVKPYEKHGQWYSKFKLLMSEDDEAPKGEEN